MGMELLEVVMEVEQEFEISIPDDCGPRIQRVSHLVSVVRTQLRIRDEAPAKLAMRGVTEVVPPAKPRRTWTDEELFLRIQEIIAHVAGVDATCIRPESHLIHDLGMD